MGYLLDTNIVTAILKNNRKVQEKMGNLDVLAENVFVAGMTYYEIKRGLIANGATRQLNDFQDLCEKYQVIVGDLAIFERAAQIHANLKRKGEPMEDADILIAATAIAHNLILVSHDSDMQRVEDLRLEDWL
ncbi:type II toxin-antitoxin system VapC family toxin [Roseofilum sp. BLCC_M154]|uniref:Type II toxin-antitoxin system VapC family toxin n=1 Tax=Roseofilum acuticapitatum BLCC-M154 TaxID=3022444 RepID=A0ABT7AWM0_9CYAN|nr:type II toxin-antitoxin system VapC family toxin [Roseofilum acuticapitatum]MDJ1171318.1 type II toxin-antitoxin system VapC family toxin [Roseofilum acuticapitatum BLCC-M154]